MNNEVGGLPLIGMNRLGFIGATTVGAFTGSAVVATFARASAEDEPQPLRFPQHIKQIHAGVLDVGYVELGPATGPTVILLHGFPYSIDSYAMVGPLLAKNGCRVLIPYLRGHGTTHFLDPRTPRAGQQAALGADLIAFMDALKVEGAIVAGYDWGGRAACVAAALWPKRCLGLVSVNGYLIQDIARATLPLAPGVESGIWYQFYFTTERGRAGLLAHRTELARTLWLRNSPSWHFDQATLERHALAFRNADYVDVVIHSYRHRLGTAAGYEEYASIESRLAQLPTISTPTITLDGKADGVIPATDGSSYAARFLGPHSHRVVDSAGHNLPEEAPTAFAAAVWELARAHR